MCSGFELRGDFCSAPWIALHQWESRAFCLALNVLSIANDYFFAEKFIPLQPTGEKLQIACREQESISEF